MNKSTEITMTRNLVSYRACACYLSLLALFQIGIVLPASAQTPPASLPAMKTFAGQLVSPSTSYYGTGTTHSYSLPSVRDDALANKRRPELKELARGLGASQLSAGQVTQDQYAQRVYEYVRQNIEITFSFGLSKGALGALIDQAGTPFDQANLMVELLREGGVSANYEIGTVTMNGSSAFTPWTGITDATAACRLLADGGIPGTVNGSSNAACTVTGAISTVQLRHVWVSALGKRYDPSFKKHTVKTGIDLSAAMGCGTASASTCGTNTQNTLFTSVSSGTMAGANYYQNLNQVGMDAYLVARATQLQSTLKATYPDSLIEDIIGGRLIDFASIDTPAAALPYTSSPTAVTSWTGDIPDAYRTKLVVEYNDINMGTTNVGAPHNSFFVDEIYGKRVWLVQARPGDENASGQDLGLYVDGELIAAGHSSLGQGLQLFLTMDHPYAYAALAGQPGSYLDERGAMTLYPGSSTTVLFGVGKSGTGAIAHFRNHQERADYNLNFKDPYGLDLPFYINPDPDPSPLAACFGCYRNSLSALVANYLAQNSRVLELIGQVNKSRVLTHHMLGYTTGIDMNVTGGVSVVSTANDAGDRKAAMYSMAALSSHLEGNVLQQGEDGFEGWTAQAYLFRANQKSIQGDYPVMRSQGIPLLLATAANFGNDSTGVRSLLKSTGYTSPVLDRIAASLSQGASVIVQRDWIFGDYRLYPGSSGHDQYWGSGYIAFMPQGDNVAYLTMDGGKGGSASGATDPLQSVAEGIKQQDSSLKAKKYYGVDVARGTLKLTPPPDIVTGAGAFPSSLSFQRFYDSSKDARLHTVAKERRAFPGGQNIWVEWMSPGIDAPMPGGWDHNFNISATLGSDAFQAFGDDSAIDASSNLATLVVLRDINRNVSAQPDIAFATHLTTSFVSYWWGTTLLNNSVVVRRPPSSDTFIRLPNGSFNPPPSSAEQLVQTGVGFGPYLDQSLLGATYAYGPVTFALTDAAGSILQFGDGAFNPSQPSSSISVNRRFPATSWTFPSGIALTFDNAIKAIPSNPLTIELRSVRNNLGRRLDFAGWNLPFANALDYPQPPLVITDENSRIVQIEGVKPTASDTFSYRVNVTDPTLKTSSYFYTLGAVENGRQALLVDAWTTPLETQQAPFVHVQYDSLMRVGSVDSAPNNPGNVRPRTDYLVGGLFNERLHRGDIVDPVGGITTQHFDLNNQVVQHIDALGRTTWKTYDSRQRLKSVIAPEGNSAEYTYDIRSNVLTEKNLPKPGSTWAATTITNTYMEGTNVFPCVNPASCNQVKTSTDKKGRIGDYDYYANGQLKQVKGPTVGSERSESDYCYTNYTTATGSLSLLTGSVNVVGGGKPNRVSTFTYSSTNKYVLDTATVDPVASLTPACVATSKAGATNLVSTFTFDALGNVRTIDGPRSDVSDVSTYTFDAMRRLKQVDGPSGTNAKTTYTYFDDGTLRYVDKQEMVGGSPVLRREERTYWPSGDLKSVQDPEGNVAQTNYDLAGRVNLATDPEGRRTGTAYDLAGQTRCIWKGWNSATAPALWTTTNPATCAWNPADYIAAGNDGRYRYVAYTYTLNGKQATIQDADANQTDLVYDKFDRLRYTLFPSPSTGSRCTAATSENVTALSCPTGATYEELRYSTSGAPATSSSGLCSGNDQVCAKRTRANQVITLTYDTMNRLSTKAAPGLPTVTSTYNLLSEPLGLTSPSQTSPAIPLHNVTYDYNDVGQKLFEKNTLNGTVRTVSYAYDQAGNRSSTTWPDNYVVSYEYDALNRMSKVWEGAPNSGIKLADYSYDSLSRRQSLQYANQPTNKVTYTYELDSNLDVLTNVLNSVTVTLDYGRNHSGQITRIDASDDFYLPSKALLTTVVYVPNKLNQYSTVGGQTQTYDSNGNMLTWFPVGGKHTYTYDSENRLRTAAVNGSVTASITYDYDSLGRRLSKTVSGTSTYYLLDGNEEIAEYSSGGTILRRYITGPAMDDRIAHIEGTGGSAVKAFYHVNHQGSVIAMTDGAGTITQKLAYDEYGLLTSDSPASPTGEQFRYTGRRFDIETGLYYYRARYYAPVEGRFLQTDPIGYKDDFNLYTYASNDPVNKSDPLGLDWFNVDNKWQWQKGHVFHDAKGNATDAKGYGGLMVVTDTGKTNKVGATIYNVKLYNQNKLVSQGTALSGGRGHPAISGGNYMIRGDIRNPPPTTRNQSSAVWRGNPPPAYGIQKINPGLIDGFDQRGSYGPMRAYLNSYPHDQSKEGSYYHGQDSPSEIGSTHGCLSYGQDTSIIDAIAGMGSVRTPVSVDTGVVEP